ncbi:MAG: PBP1A family penicillin-binding protein [Candidatus Sericytochromatia bacterium]|nr:PBP1A family penicillin-binding protein [Candidatus Sericytochromatia bacterium]
MPGARSVDGAERDREPRPARRKTSVRKPRKPLGRAWKIAGFVVVVSVSGACGAAWGVARAFRSLPAVEDLQRYVPFETTVVLDAYGGVLAKVHGEENRTVVPLGEVPPLVRQAVIAAEDVRFYRHPGVDARGILRALIKDIAGRKAEEGASTLTQQLAKNLFLSPSRTLARKLADAWLAIRIERRYSKDQILELYLNQVYWGHNAYGIEAASQTYFGRGVRTLGLAEGALLAGLLSEPERASPYRRYKRALQHQRNVLRKMVAAGFITQSQAMAAQAQTLPILPQPPRKRETLKAPYFTSYLLDDLRERFGADYLQKSGLRISTTLNPNWQAKAEELVTEVLKRDGKSNRFSQATLIALEPQTGAIRAMVGGADWSRSQFNRAVQAHRQPGSSFKPVLYLTAFAQGIAPTLVFSDEPRTWTGGDGKPWTPLNYGGERYGALPLRRALEISNNVIAVKLIERVGASKVVETARRLGFRSDIQPNLSLALGTSEVTPLELAAAFATFAAEGKFAPPQAWTRLTDRTGTVLQRRVPRAVQVVPPGPIRILNDVLQGVILRGTGYAARIGRPAAGKTGTTSDHRDAWFVGYTPELVTLVWVGNDDNSTMTSGTTGGEVCAPLWARFMTHALKQATPSAFVSPEVPKQARAKVALPSRTSPQPDLEGAKRPPRATGLPAKGERATPSAAAPISRPIPQPPLRLPERPGKPASGLDDESL